MNIFQRYLSIWVFICMISGVILGQFFPHLTQFLLSLEYSKISIPMTILLWLMIYPMMLKVDFQSLKDIKKHPSGLAITWIVNWLIKPFSIYAISYLFLFYIFRTFITPDLATGYLSGIVLLGAAPCTAMVFVWSHLTKGNAAYTVIQVASNDLIILIAFVPIVSLLLGISHITVPIDTLILSITLFVIIPLVLGIITRIHVVKRKGKHYFENIFLKKFEPLSMMGLLLTLILIFVQQSQIIVANPLHIILIAIPLTIQTFFIFYLSYGTCKFMKLPQDIAAPAGMIGASNFFELAVAVAISLFGANSPAVLATTVGVLTEVPIMLILVKLANKAALKTGSN